MYCVEGRIVDVWADNDGGLWFYKDGFIATAVDEKNLVIRRRKTMGCPMGNRPDCFNCPLPDCNASTLDMSRQECVKKEEAMIARDKVIVSEYLKGAEINGLAERFGFKDPTSIRRILKRAGVDFKRIEKEKRICRK